MKQEDTFQYDMDDDKDDDGKSLYKSGKIDLHNYSTGVALDLFVCYYNDEIKNRANETIKVIHGYGSSGIGGEIRTRVRTFLKEHSDCLRFELGENIDDNPGYTLVYPNRPLPPMSDSISGKILEFCATAKSEEKIFGKFRLYGDVEVKKAIKSLEKQGKIRPIEKGKFKHYVTINP